MSTDHTVFPWEHVPDNGHHGHYIVAGSGITVCDLYAMTQPISGKSKAANFTDAAENAAFIARACNAHDDLVAAINLLIKSVAGLPEKSPHNNYAVAKARDALLKAGVE